MPEKAVTVLSQVAEFTQVLQQLPSGSLLAAAFITYLGGEPEDVRQATLTQWCADLKVSPPWSLIKFLASETELLTWKSQGNTVATFGEAIERAHAGPKNEHIQGHKIAHARA